MAAILKTNFGTKKEILLFAVTFIPAVIILNLVMYGIRYFTDWKLFLVSSATGLAISILFQNGLVIVNMFFRKKYPGYKETAKRFLFCLSATLITTSLLLLACIWAYQLIPVLAYPVTQKLVITFLLAGGIFNIVSSSIHEAFYTFDKFRETLVENESLKKEKLQQQFDNLKTKVNPHFLFNSLSTLSMLVSEDTDKADTFLNEMSKVYRYMLKSNQHEMVELQRELSFINSYFYLIKVRYGNTITLQIKADEKYNTYLLTPLTLFVLLENALQHNAALKELPLIIQIETNSNNSITVKNNLQRKKLTVQTTGKGLETLRAKYRVPGFTIYETANEFMVTIPLQFNPQMQTAVHG
jgi:sensor histidine kinase YesM